MSEKLKLFIGAPIHETVDPHFVKCFAQLSAGYNGSDCIIYPHIGDSLITRARNSITRQFLATDCTHLLFIDSDLVFSNHHVERILKHKEDIVGGAYCKKQEGPPQLVANSLDGQAVISEHDSNVVKVKYVGTGFMRISRRVFEDMIAKFGEEIWYNCDDGERTLEHDFWKAAVYTFPDNTRRYLSEDWWFCQKAMDIGYDIWMDLACVLKHSGGGLWPNQEQEKLLFAKQPSPLLANRAGDSALPTVEPAQPTSRINADMVTP